MKEGLITKHDLDRIVNAVEHEMELKPVEKPRVVVKDLESKSDESHIVNLEKGNISCTCKDWKYNCKEGEYCKHCFRAMFEYFKLV